MNHDDWYVDDSDEEPLNAPETPLWSPASPPLERQPVVRLTPRTQERCRCVATCLAALSPPSVTPRDYFDVHKADPYAWSRALEPHGLKLAYCNTVPTSLAHYVDELVALDALFLVGVYTEDGDGVSDGGQRITAPLNGAGTNGGSHLVVVQGDQLFDPSGGNVKPLRTSHYVAYAVKRIFRVVPLDYARGL